MNRELIIDSESSPEVDRELCASYEVLVFPRFNYTGTVRRIYKDIEF